MASIENTTFKIIESITPTINDNIKFLLEENNNYKKKYENLMNEHKMILEFPLVKNIIKSPNYFNVIYVIIFSICINKKNINIRG